MSTMSFCVGVGSLTTYRGVRREAGFGSFGGTALAREAPVRSAVAMPGRSGRRIRWWSRGCDRVGEPLGAS